MTLLTDQSTLMEHESSAVRQEVLRKFAEKNIKVVVDARVSKVTAEAVHLEDGRQIECNVAIWATGAEP